MDSIESKISSRIGRTVAIIASISFMCFVAYAWNKIYDEFRTWGKFLSMVSEMQYRHLQDWERNSLLELDKFAVNESFIKEFEEMYKGSEEALRKVIYPLKTTKTEKKGIDYIITDSVGGIIYNSGINDVYSPDMLFLDNGRSFSGRFDIKWSDSLNTSLIVLSVPIGDTMSPLGFLISVMNPNVELHEMLSDLPNDNVDVKSHLYKVVDGTPVLLSFLGDSACPNCELLKNIVEVSNGSMFEVKSYGSGRQKVIANMLRLPLSNLVLLSEISTSDVRSALTNTLLFGFAMILAIVLLGFLFVAVFQNMISHGMLSRLLKRTASLKMQAKELQAVLTSINDAIITCDKVGRIWHINSIAQQLIGFNQRQALGHNILSIFNLNVEETDDNTEKMFKNAIHDGQKVIMPNGTFLSQKNGERIPISGTFSPVFNDLKILTGLVITFRDESDKYYKARVLEQGVVSYDQIFDSNPHPMCIYEIATRKIENVNQAACDLIGYTKEELLNMTISDFSTPQFVELMKNTGSEVSANLFGMDEWDVVTRSGDKLTLSKTAFDLQFNGKQCRYLLVGNKTPYKHTNDGPQIMQQHYVAMMTEFPEAVFVVDARSKIVFANNECLKLFGATLNSQLVGENISTVFHSDIMASIKSRVNEIFVSMQNGPTDKRKMTRLDGSSFMAEITGMPLDNYGKKYIQVLVKTESEANVKNDVSDNRLRTFEKLGGLIVWELDPDYNCIYVNEMWKRFVGERGVEFAHGTDWINLVHPDDRESKVIKNKDAWQRREPFQTECRMLGADGNYYWMLVNASPNFDENGNFCGYVGYYIDINRRRVAEAEMEKALKVVEESSYLKTKFLATLSHDIRTPMNAIIGFADCMQMAKSTDDIKPYLSHVTKNTFQLLDIVTNTTEMSKIESNLVEINVSKFKIRKFVDDVYNETKEQEEKQLYYMYNNNLPEDAEMTTDRGKLKMVMRHLLCNAIRYTHDGGTVTFDVSMENGKLLFSVADTGIGVDVKDHARVFETFYRVENADTMAIRGLGLGLPISKSYVEKLGGILKFQSALNAGTIVTVELPCLQMVKKNADSQFGVTNLFVGKKSLVLLAEDDEFGSVYIKTILENNGCRVKHVYDGEAAVNAVKENPEIKLVLLDLQMPIINGFDALVQIRQFNAEVPVVAQTRIPVPDCDAKMHGCKFDSVVDKPIRKEILISLIDKYLKNK